MAIIKVIIKAKTKREKTLFEYRIKGFLPPRFLGQERYSRGAKGLLLGQKSGDNRRP